MRTYSAKPKDTKRQWYILDAAQMPLGRLATQAASLLLGKGKPQITPHIDIGDYVIIINAKSLVTSGQKLKKKVYYRHSGFPGGLYQRTLEEVLNRDPTSAVLHAVRGMVPDNKLRKNRLARLKIYAAAEHNHSAQNPQPINLKGK